MCLGYKKHYKPYQTKPYQTLVAHALPLWTSSPHSSSPKCRMGLWFWYTYLKHGRVGPSLHLSLHHNNFGTIESYVFTGLLRHLISMGGWPQRTRGSRRSRSARAQGRQIDSTGLRPSGV